MGRPPRSAAGALVGPVLVAAMLLCGAVSHAHSASMSYTRCGQTGGLSYDTDWQPPCFRTAVCYRSYYDFERISVRGLHACGVGCYTPALETVSAKPEPTCIRHEVVILGP